MHRDLVDKMIEHKHALLFVGGVATAIVGKKILESQTTKDYVAKGMAKVLTCKSDLEESIQDIKDNAEDIHTDAKAAKKDAVCVDISAEEAKE
jgi:methylmalonyl-CoA mutase cobalamin-binding subunit